MRNENREQMIFPYYVGPAFPVPVFSVPIKHGMLACMDVSYCIILHHISTTSAKRPDNPVCRQHVSRSSWRALSNNVICSRSGRNHADFCLLDISKLGLLLTSSQARVQPEVFGEEKEFVYPATERSVRNCYRRGNENND